MERPNLIPHLTEKEEVALEYNKHLAKLKARVAKIQEKMESPSPLGIEEKKEITIKHDAPFVPEMNKTTGEHLEKEYVMVDGQMVLKEFADQ
jgi:hypothetical protein